MKEHQDVLLVSI